jgi:hypothetical protein
LCVSTSGVKENTLSISEFQKRTWKYCIPSVWRNDCGGVSVVHFEFNSSGPSHAFQKICNVARSATGVSKWLFATWIPRSILATSTASNGMERVRQCLPQPLIRYRSKVTPVNEECVNLLQLMRERAQFPYPIQACTIAIYILCSWTQIKVFSDDRRV